MLTGDPMGHGGSCTGPRREAGSVTPAPSELMVVSIAGKTRFYSLSFTRLFTTEGSARVEVSPSSSTCPHAIFLNILLIIFPLLVFGSPGAKWSLSGVAIGPITVLT